MKITMVNVPNYLSLNFAHHKLSTFGHLGTFQQDRFQNLVMIFGMASSLPQLDPNSSIRLGC